MKSGLPHLVVENLEERGFTSPQSGGKASRGPSRIRDQHSAYLQEQLRNAWAAAQNDEVVYHSTRTGVYLEFKGEQGYELVTKSLESMRVRDGDRSIRLLNVRV